MFLEYVEQSDKERERNRDDADRAGSSNNSKGKHLARGGWRQASSSNRQQRMESKQTKDAEASE